MSDTNIHALPIGHTIDGYRILRLLGAGGFGITYLAEEIQIGRKVAIKEYLPQGFAARAADSATVRPVSAASKEQYAWGLDRFRKEAATLVAFEHPNIVSVFRYFEANATAYLVMQYVEGKPLDALVGGGKKLEESEIEEVILPILGGLEQVHAAHILHRDIKPANIFIRKDGRPVLLDFGAARQAFGSETKSITAIVSEGYAPFEQYEARGDQGPWTDVYALGAVLYRCITGERPPAAPERVSARLRGAPDPMPSARVVGAGRYSPRLLEATDRALSTMAADRPQSIAELRALLTASDGASRVQPAGYGASGATGMATAVHTISTGAPKPKSRVPLMAGIAGAVAVAGVAAYFALASKPPGPNTAATPTVPPTTVSATTPTAPSADELAERAAKEAEAKADADLAALRDAIGRGELARARDDVVGLIGRIDEALRKRPGHAGLRRASAAARDAQTDLASRIAARVKELVEGAERQGPENDAEAERLVGEAERLDPAAAKAARERIEASRRTAKGQKERQELVAQYISLARYHLEQARSAAMDGRFVDARGMAAQTKVQLDRAAEAHAVGAPKAPQGFTMDPPAPVKDLRRDLEVFERDLTRRIAARVAVLTREARELVGAGKLDDAAKRLDEAKELEPASAELAAARRELEEARKKPQAPPDPDAAERERTKGIVPESTYDARNKRGVAYFAFQGSELIPAAAQALAKAVNAAKGEKAALALTCSYDTLEESRANEGRALARERCAAVQRAAVRQGFDGRVLIFSIAGNKGAEHRRVTFAMQVEKPPEAAKPPEPQGKPGAYQLAGRTARLSRIAAQRRAVLRIELRFEAGGGLAVSCSAEGADGAQSACFGQRTGRGRWTLNGSTLCLSSPVVDLPNNGCYEVSGGGNQLRLAGAGVLAGTMLLQ